MIPISTVDLGPEAERLVLEVLRSGMIAQGPMVVRLEREFATLTGTKHAVAVNNGTTALVAALQVLGLGPSDEVVTSPFTFVATLNAILQSGATAKFADISEADFCISPAAVESRISDRTAALLPVHLYGQCADMTSLAALSAKYAIPIVEDAAQAHGADINGRSAGTFGLGCFSFYATKNLTTGEGGIITTDDDQLADKLRVLRNQGMRLRYQYETAGHNYRLTDLQAAIALPQIATYDSNIARRRHNAARLTTGLDDVVGLRVPRQLPYRGHVWHQYTVLVDDGSPVDREEFVARLNEAGVGCGVYYPRLVYDYDCYRDHPQVVSDPVPTARSVTERCASLPVHHHLRDTDIDKVIEVVREVMKA